MDSGISNQRFLQSYVGDKTGFGSYHIWRRKRMSDKIRVLLPEEEVEERIRQIGKQITEDYALSLIHI